MRWAARSDTTQSQIVAGLRRHGVQVFVIKQPCDLLCRYYDNALRRWLWQPLELKTPYGKRAPKPRTDKRQKDQLEFLASTRTPVVTSLSQALDRLGLPNPYRGTSAACTSVPISPPTSSVGNR